MGKKYPLSLHLSICSSVHPPTHSETSLKWTSFLLGGPAFSSLPSPGGCCLGEAAGLQLRRQSQVRAPDAGCPAPFLQGSGPTDQSPPLSVPLSYHCQRAEWLPGLPFVAWVSTFQWTGREAGEVVGKLGGCWWRPQGLPAGWSPPQ